jgi:hypothetical protein
MVVFVTGLALVALTLVNWWLYDAVGWWAVWGQVPMWIGLSMAWDAWDARLSQGDHSSEMELCRQSLPLLPAPDRDRF